MARDSKRTLLCLFVSSVVLGLSRVAAADVAACVDAHASGQREAKAGRLEAASALFAACVSEAGCPDTIRAECAELRKETERNLPTLIFAVLDEQGADLTEVRVYVDDRVMTKTLDGRPIAIDPGEHRFRFELSSGEVLTSNVLVREGEKNRIVSLRAKSEHAPQSSAEQSRRRLPTGFWVASGVGAAALASFGTFALLGHGKQSTLAECSPNCSDSSRADYDAMHRDYLIADISLGVAVASAGVATWLFFSSDRASTADSQAANSQPSRFSVAPLVSTRGAGLVLSASAF
ncbi:MAG TPA: hypothetical protein VER04_12820 [Polyangiaceae bacterium]|nr:hypothetical protein [Polyangiaceae bacterium]